MAAYSIQKDFCWCNVEEAKESSSSDKGFWFYFLSFFSKEVLNGVILPRISKRKSFAILLSCDISETPI